MGGSESGGGVRLVPFFGLLSLVCLSVVLGEAFATGVRGCAFGLVARFRARVVDAAGDAPAWAGSAAPAKARPSGHKSGQVAPVSRPGLPLRVGGAVQEFVPRVTTTGVCQAEDPTSPCGAATSPEGGMHSICVSLYWGFDSRWSTKSLSPPPESLRRVGAIEATERVAVAHGLMRPHSRVSRRGYKDSRYEMPPLQGTPSFFCDPGDGMWRLVCARFGPPGVCRCGDYRACVLWWSIGCVMFWGGRGGGLGVGLGGRRYEVGGRYGGWLPS